MVLKGEKEQRTLARSQALAADAAFLVDVSGDRAADAHGMWERRWWR